MAGHLKTFPEYFQPIIEGKKPFEIRYNDRNFKTGDLYILEEFTGVQAVPECPDYYHCDYYGYIYAEDEARAGCPFCRDMCCSYSKDIYTGRRCLIKIKEIFKLDSIGFKNYVAFTFDIKNIIDKTKDNSED